jgi:hypothetical protein
MSRRTLPDSRDSVAMSTSATLWRAVETQHVASTMRLVDSIEAQAVLEQALESSKPPIPRNCEGLDYLLHTPFRYPPSPWPSRFRGPTDPGVFYGAERARTALAEVAHWRLKVLLDAVDLRALEPTAHTLFSVRIEAIAIDVADLADASQRTAILDPDDYSTAQRWARAQRESGIQAIRYPSVRDRPDGICWAALQPGVFRSRPALRENWLIRVTRAGAQCNRIGEPVKRIAFDAGALLARTHELAT